MVTPLTKREAARYLGVSVKTIERRIKAGALERTIVHGPHGPEVRVYLDATPDVAPATNPVAATLATVEAVDRVAAPPNPSTGVDGELARAILRALEEAQRENQAWARRYGKLEAEVESLRQAQTGAQGPLQWLRAWLRRGRSDA